MQRWSEDNYHAQPSHMGHGPTVMQEPYLSKQQQQNPHMTSPFDPNSMFPYNTMNDMPYQGSPYDFDSRSLPYSDRMDTDVSSISQGSVHSSMSSTSHLDIMFDSDVNSAHSLSRKPSLISNYEPEPDQGTLCPLFTGQVSKCDPSLCGPNAPCLQYVNQVPPIEECVPDTERQLSSSNNEQNTPIDFTTPHTSPQLQHKIQRVNTASGGVVPSKEVARAATPDDAKRPQPKPRRSTTKVNTSDIKDETPITKQTKKTRARQAHSLVERKYRENLNAKIQELHQLLQRTHLNRSNQQDVNRSSIQTHHHHHHDDVTDQDDCDDNADDRASSKVKKSDVLIEAMNYVHSTEAEMVRMRDEIRQLNDRIQMMENWMRKGMQ